MGVYVALVELGEGFHRRVSDLHTDRLFELANLLKVDTAEAPDTDLYDWLRQRIYDDLVGEVGKARRP